MLRYMFKRLLRAPLLNIALVLMCAIVAMVMGSLQAAGEQERQNYEEIFASVEVDVEVTDLTGLRSDDLKAPGWVETVFTKPPLNSCFRDVTIGMKASIQMLDTEAEKDGGPVSYGLMLPDEGGELVGVNSFAALKQLLADSGASVTWNEGFDETVFDGYQVFCILPHSILTRSPAFTDCNAIFRWQGDPTSQLEVMYKKQFVVAGTHDGAQNVVYCAYRSVVDVYNGLGRVREIDFIKATVANNRELDTVRELLGEWFTEPDSSGEKVPWDYSWYSYYPYAVRVDDTKLQAAAKTLETSLRLHEICSWLILAMALAAGFLAGFLTVRGRRMEITLLCTLGTRRRTIFFVFLLEQLACVTLGLMLGGAYYQWEPARQLLMFLTLYCVSLSAALPVFLNQNLMIAIKEND